jgi:hypothetical protein
MPVPAVIGVGAKVEGALEAVGHRKIVRAGRPAFKPGMTLRADHQHVSSEPVLLDRGTCRSSSGVGNSTIVW